MKRWEEDDFYASDEDEFMDRTGDIGRKRKMRRTSGRRKKNCEEQQKNTNDNIRRLRKGLGALRVVPDGRQVYGLSSHSPHAHTETTQKLL